MADKKNDTGIRQFPGNKPSGKLSIAFGDIIKNYRVKANLDQEQVAQVCGITPSTVSNWERGRSRPDLAQIPALCNCLGISLEVFFDMPSMQTMSRDETNLIQGYRYLSTPNKRQVLRIVDAIIESQEEARREGYKKNYCYLMGHDVGLAAGFGAPVDEEPDTYPVFVRISREALRSDDVFPVNGQSMEPDYPDGSMVFVERVTADELSYGDIIACIASGTPFVKIYEKDGLHSINPKYKPIHVGDDDNFRLIGRVVGLVPPEDLASKTETAELMEVFADELQ